MNHEDPHLLYNLRRQYLYFAGNRKFTEEEIGRDFDALVADDKLISLDFFRDNPRIMMLQTPVIDILHQGVYRRVGAFVVFIHRWHQDRSWRVSYRFININGLMHQRKGDYTTSAHHPHIIDNECKELGMDAGMFCMSEGASLIENPLKEGRVNIAYPRILEALLVYPTGTPYIEIDQWPIVGQTAKEES